MSRIATAGVGGGEEENKKMDLKSYGFWAFRFRWGKIE